MILVTLGTQDKSFTRLLKLIDEEITNKTITDEVIVQAGYTKYKSPNMKIFDLISTSELDKLIDKCTLLITHGGVGSILTGLKHNKTIIAIARLKKYGEHTNNHQLQVIDNLYQQGYILKYDETIQFKDIIKESTTFKPKTWESNTNNFIDMLTTYINNK